MEAFVIDTLKLTLFLKLFELILDPKTPLLLRLILAKLLKFPKLLRVRLLRLARLAMLRFPKLPKFPKPLIEARLDRFVPVEQVVLQPLFALPLLPNIFNPRGERNIF